MVRIALAAIAITVALGLYGGYTAVDNVQKVVAQRAMR